MAVPMIFFIYCDAEWTNLYANMNLGTYDFLFLPRPQGVVYRMRLFGVVS